MITGAQAMVKCLENEGVELIFGYPGAAICPFFDALLDSRIRSVLVRQEQNAAHSASGYARISRKAGVCVVTSGPGATNLLTGLATAYADSIPIIAISGQVRSDLIGRDVFQEADITGAAEPFVKYSYLIKDVKDIPRAFKEAFHIATTGRPGPVLIDIPIDIQQKKLVFEYPQQVNIKGYKPSVKGHNLQIQKVLSELKRAKKPIVCIGGGIFAADAQKELVEFIDKFGIPSVSTMMGIGALPTDHPLNLGMLGTHGRASTNRAIHEADLFIIIGARIGDRAIAAPHILAERTKIIHIDVDPAEIGKNMAVTVPVVGDAKIILNQLIESSSKLDIKEWIDKITDYKQEKEIYELCENTVNPKYFINRLSERLEDNAVFVADVGQNQMWSARHCKIKKGRFLTSGGLGTMGYSIPAAIGAKLAEPGRQVVAVCGDGSFQMSFMELATACQHNVPIKLVIMNNNSLGMVKEIQDKIYNCRNSSVDLSGSPDFIKIANAYGINALRITSSKDTDRAIDQMLKDDKAFILECKVSPNELSL